MGLENKKITRDFEAMLQRHFVNNEALLKACHEFDANTGVAWMEGILHGLERMSYEQHLASCPQCRQITLELSRLNRDLNLAFVPPPGLLDRLYQYRLRASEWFPFIDTAALFRHPAFGGAVLSLCVITAVAWIAYQPKYSNYSQSTTLVVTSATNGANTTNSFAQSLSVNEQPVSTVQNLAGTNIPQPGVSVNFAVTGSTVPVNQRVNLPAIDTAVKLNLDASGQQLVASLPVSDSNSIPDIEIDLPPPTSNRRYLALSEAGGEKKRGFISASVNKLSVFPNLLDNMWGYVQPNGNGSGMRRGMTSSFLPVSTGKEMKLPKKIETIDEAERPLVKKLFGKTFKFMNGGWMDQDFDYETMGWRGVIKLHADSKEYKRILSEEPALKEFFQLGKVTVVWNDKIYKVTP